MSTTLPPEIRVYFAAVANCATDVAPWSAFLAEHQAALDAAVGRARRLRLRFAPSTHLPRLLDELGIGYDAEQLERHLRRASDASWTGPRTHDWMGLDAAHRRGHHEEADRALARWMRERVARVEAEDYDAPQEINELFSAAEAWIEDGRLHLAASVLVALARVQVQSDLVIGGVWARTALARIGGLVPAGIALGPASDQARLAPEIPPELVRRCAALTWNYATDDELEGAYDSVAALLDTCGDDAELAALRRRLRSLSA